MKHFLLLLVPLLLCACQKEDADNPSTPQAMYDMAQELLKPNVENAESDFAGALQWLRRAAEGGLLRAQLDLGGIYYAGGHGLEADARQAYDWFLKAAAQGSREAEVFLGMLQYEGRLGEKNVQEAMKHWRIAAEAGIAEGQYRLGRLLTVCINILGYSFKARCFGACVDQYFGITRFDKRTVTCKLVAELGHMK